MAVKVVFECEGTVLAADLIADCFYTLGLKGVVIDDPVADPDEDWGDDALPLPEKDAVTGYLPMDNRLENTLTELQADLAKLERTAGIRTLMACSEIDEEDWAHAWKAFFHPERVGRHLVVKPTWRDYDPRPGDKILEIDPGMAFGTGTHPTTAMCLALLEDHLAPGSAFLDVGTGSGILMTAAAKLGAARGLGIDNDPVAVEIAGRNLQLNGADPQRFTVTAGDLVTVVTEPYDLVAANILSDVIVRLLEDLPGKMAPGGLVITSGIIEDNAARVTDKMAAQGLEVLEIQHREGWVAIVGRKTT